MLRTVLKQLQEIYHINDAELARETGIPQATIYRLVSGMTDDPKISSLKPLSAFFNITIGQLLGEEPLPSNLAERPAGANRWSYRMPIISWEQAVQWESTVTKLTPSNWTDWCSTNFPISNFCYALEIKNKTFAVPFTHGSVIILEPNLHPEDGDIVAVHFSNMNAVSLRRWVVDGGEVLLDSLQPGVGGTRFLKDCSICGVVIQVYMQLKEKIL